MITGQIWKLAAIALAGVCIALLMALGGAGLWVWKLQSDVDKAITAKNEANATAAVCAAGMNKLKADAELAARLRAEAAERAASDIASANDRIAKLASMRGEGCEAMRSAVDVFWEGRKK